jgi:hypothetical protein
MNSIYILLMTLLVGCKTTPETSSDLESKEAKNVDQASNVLLGTYATFEESAGEESANIQPSGPCNIYHELRIAKSELSSAIVAELSPKMGGDCTTARLAMPESAYKFMFLEQPQFDTQDCSQPIVGSFGGMVINRDDSKPKRDEMDNPIPTGPGRIESFLLSHIAGKCEKRVSNAIFWSFTDENGKDRVFVHKPR